MPVRSIPISAALAILATLLANPAPAALIGYYSMEQASAGPMLDLTSSPANATQVGSGHLYQQPSIPGGNYGDVLVPAGGLGFTAGLNSTNGYWQIAGANKFGNLVNDFTVMAWIKPDTTTGIMRIVASSTSGGWGFGLDGSRVFMTGYGVVDTRSSLNAVTANTWQHVAVTKSSATGVTFFVNGSQVSTIGGETRNWNSTTGDYAMLAGVGGGQNFVGLTDEIRVYDTALSSGEIIAVASIPEPSAAIIGLLGATTLLRRRRS